MIQKGIEIVPVIMIQTIERSKLNPTGDANLLKELKRNKAGPRSTYQQRLKKIII